MVYEGVTDAKYRDIIGFFRSRGRILALLIVNRETEKGYRPVSTFFLLLFWISALPLHSRALRRFSRHKSDVGEKCEPERSHDRPPRCRCIAGNCDRFNNKFNNKNWFIAFSVQSRRARPPHVLYASRAATASNPFA